MTTELHDAVEDPTDDQRKGLPDAAYAAVFKVEDVTRKILPHHINTVKSATDNGTVDLPRLRNALARYDQLKGVPSDVKAKALAHIEAHAKALKVGAREQTEAAMGKERLAHFEERVQFMVDSTQTTDVKETAPNGKPFLAVLEGRAAVVGIINANRRLYPPAKMGENQARIKARIARAFENAGSTNNHDLIVGEADHPEFGSRTLATCTVLLDFEVVGHDVRAKFGVMDVGAGRDVMALQEYGVPLGVSSRSIGIAETKTMDHDNPFYALNREHDGVDYDEITDFEIEALDLVVTPAAGTFIGESVDQEHRTQLRETYERLTQSPARNEANGGESPIMEKMPPSGNDTEEKSMDDKVKEALANLTPEQLKEAAPALFDSVAVSAQEAATKAAEEKAAEEKRIADEQAAEEKRIADEQAAAEAKLAEEKAEAEKLTLQDRLAAIEEAHRTQVATVDTLREAVKRLTDEKAAAEYQVALDTAVREACSGLPHGELRERHIRTVLGTDPREDLAEAVKAAAEAADAEIKLYFGALKQEPADTNTKPADDQAVKESRKPQSNGEIPSLPGGLSIPLTALPASDKETA